MAKRTRGGKYERTDGSTIADDGVDRRYKHSLFGQEHVDANAGQKQKWTPSKIKEYRVTFNDDTPHVIIEATSAKAARAIAAARYSSKKIKDVKNVKNNG